MPALDLAAAARNLGLALPKGAIQRLQRYRNLIIEASSAFNLTAVRDPDAIDRRHLLESLALTRLLEAQDLLPLEARVVDIGSGAGLPGIPIAIARPDLHVSLLESHEKKCDFMRRVAAELGLERVQVLEGRAESVVAEPGQRAAYDLAIARAVAPLPVLVEYALPFLRVGGHLAATKGSAAEREITEAAMALRELGGEIGTSLPFIPPEGRAQMLIVVRKIAPTPARFPRRVGVASKRPLR
jgi:16S rRNA (guanine527-N7)-methyltransferase